MGRYPQHYHHLNHQTDALIQVYGQVHEEKRTVGKRYQLIYFRRGQFQTMVDYYNRS